MAINEMNRILRNHYEFGSYPHTHFRISQVTIDRISQTVLGPPFPTPPISLFFGIPIRIDPTVPVGHWRLADNSSEEVLGEGTFEDE